MVKHHNVLPLGVSIVMEKYTAICSCACNRLRKSIVMEK